MEIPKKYLSNKFKNTWIIATIDRHLKVAIKRNQNQQIATALQSEKKKIKNLKLLITINHQNISSTTTTTTPTTTATAITATTIVTPKDILRNQFTRDKISFSLN